MLRGPASFPKSLVGPLDVMPHPPAGILSHSGLFWPTVANGAISSCKVTTDGGRLGVRVPNSVGLIVLHRGTHPPSLWAFRTVALEMLKSDPPVAHLLAACCLLHARRLLAACLLEMGNPPWNTQFM